jgi:hypothetical protein
MPRIPKNSSRKVKKPVRTPGIHGKTDRTETDGKRARSPRLQKPAMLAANRLPSSLNGRSIARSTERRTEKICRTETEALELVIPCRTGTPDRIKPLRIEIPCSCGSEDHVSVLFQCEQCTVICHTYRAWKKHAGMISNIKGSCPGG